MTCDEIRELLPAYVLDALSEVELNEVDAHLDGCAEHLDELEELRTGLAVVEGSIPEREPSLELRASLLERAGTRRTPTVRVAPEQVQPRPSRLIRAQWAWWRVPAYAAAAVAVLALGIAGAWTVFQGGDRASTMLVREVLADVSPGLRIEYDSADSEAVVTPLGLPSSPAGRVYQLWVIHPGAAPESLGLVNDAVDSTTVVVSLDEGDVVAITEEPAGGSEQPTSAPLVSLEI